MRSGEGDEGIDQPCATDEWMRFIEAFDDRRRTLDAKADLFDLRPSASSTLGVFDLRRLRPSTSSTFDVFD